LVHFGKSHVLNFGISLLTIRFCQWIWHIFMDQKLTTKPFCGFTQKLGVLTPYDPQKTHLRFTIN